VAKRIGEPLLDDPVGRQVEPGRERPDWLLDVGVDAQPEVGEPIQEQRVGMQGKLHLSVLEASAKEATLSFWIDPDQNSITSGIAQDELAQLKKPVVVKADALCEFTSYGFAPDVGPDAQNQVRGIVQSAQIVLAKDPGARAWQHLEYDMSGRFGAKYSRVNDTPRSVRKSKYAYVEVFPPVTRGSANHQPTQHTFTARVRESDTLAHWSEDGNCIDNLASVERVLGKPVAGVWGATAVAVLFLHQGASLFARSAVLKFSILSTLDKRSSAPSAEFFRRG
jgi:hypothetical protein